MREYSREHSRGCWDIERTDDGKKSPVLGQINNNNNNNNNYNADDGNNNNNNNNNSNADDGNNNNNNNNNNNDYTNNDNNASVDDEVSTSEGDAVRRSRRTRTQPDRLTYETLGGVAALPEHLTNTCLYLFDKAKCTGKFAREQCEDLHYEFIERPKTILAAYYAKFQKLSYDLDSGTIEDANAHLAAD